MSDYETPRMKLLDDREVVIVRPNDVGRLLVHPSRLVERIDCVSYRNFRVHWDKRRRERYSVPIAFADGHSVALRTRTEGDMFALWAALAGQPHGPDAGQEEPWAYWRVERVAEALEES